MQGSAHAVNKLEVHLRKIVVEHQRDDARFVHLEREDYEVKHELHVIGNVLRNLIGRARQVRLLQRRTPAFKAFFFRRMVNAVFNVADGFQIFIKFFAVAGTDFWLK